jgi:hypothetical protein
VWTGFILVQDRGQWQTLVKVIIHRCIPKKRQGRIQLLDPTTRGQGFGAFMKIHERHLQAIFLKRIQAVYIVTKLRVGRQRNLGPISEGARTFIFHVVA